MMLDAHQHFWRYDERQYDWIEPSMGRIRRDFLPADLLPLTTACGIAGTIAVQARQTLEETDWLLGLADQHPQLIKSVVGWMPLRDRGAGIDAILSRWGDHHLLKGVRHVLQGEPDDYMADAAFNAAVGRLGKYNLTYDLLIRAPQAPAALAFVDRHPELRIVLDHIVKPVVRERPDPAWIASIREFARREHVWCKFSGVVTEVPGWAWTSALVQPYFDIVLAAFGPGRVMFGSDWPVCLVAAEYREWHDHVRGATAALSPDEQAAVLGGTAARFYRIGTA